MPNCVVYGCTNRWDSTSKLKGITFHSFPLDQSRRAVWIHALRRKDWQPNKWSRICSVHFREEDIDRTSVSTVRIRENAIPSVFPGFPSHLQKKQIKRRSPKHREQTSKCTTATSIPQNEAATGIPQDDAALSVAHTETATSGPQDAAALMPANTLSPFVKENSEDTPVVKNLKRDVSVLLTKNEQYRKKLKVLQQSKRRLVKKVASLNSVIEELRRKHLVDEDSLGVLASIPGVHKELLQRQAAKANCQSVPRTYSPELRSFALTLNFYSPRAYKYVRKCFNTCLPHQRTLARWYQCVDGLPGFNSEAFAIIRANANHQTQGKQIVCSLLIDEIAIRQHIEFDGVKYYGYVDMGSSVEMDNLPIAKEAFVLMLVAINGSWKLPVGYFLTCGITGEQKAHLVKQCISLASASGIRVVSLSCDGCASNLSMAKCLGCNLNVDELKTTFAVQGDSFEVAFLLDPPHMLKLVRNALGDKKHFWDGEGHLISWYLFDVLHKLQVKEGLHIGNSITSSHINFVNNKMKVKLAAQLLSTSVADAMQYCSDIKVPGFEDAASTIKFIRVFNCLFDILNSRNLLQNKWKQPLNIHNFKVVEGFLLEAQQYIKTLTVSQVCRGTRVVDSNRKTGFVGFLVCISSVLHLYANLVEPQSSVQLLKFIPVYKCSQDHLEMFFSALRSRGGWNNNPTARQFISAYKKLLIHNEIRESERGNCMALEDIPILTYNGQNIEQQINLTTERRQLIDRESHLISHDHDYVESEVILSEVATHIVVYIAGFVVRHLERTLQCELCLSVLRGQGSHTAYSLIHRKNRGGLISPSDDVIDICLCSEKVFRKYSAGKRKVPENYLHCKCVSDVLSTFLFKPVFKELSEHMKDQHPLDNHLILLIKAVAKRYLLTRQKHAAKCETDALHEKRMRTAYTKLILFKGQ